MGKLSLLVNATTASAPSAEQVRVELARVLGSAVFAQAGRSTEFLRFVVEETLAGRADRLKGYAIVARRYKTPVGEIDMVALKGKRLAFIEVKRRKTQEDAAWTLPALLFLIVAGSLAALGGGQEVRVAGSPLATEGLPL